MKTDVLIFRNSLIKKNSFNLYTTEKALALKKIYIIVFVVVSSLE